VNYFVPTSTQEAYLFLRRKVVVAVSVGPLPGSLSGRNQCQLHVCNHVWVRNRKMKRRDEDRWREDRWEIHGRGEEE